MTPSDPSRMNRAWSAFGKQIHQDFLLDHPDFFSGLPMVWQSVPQPLRKEVIVFLRAALESGARGAALSKLWQESGAEIFVPENQIAEFLRQILAAIEAEDAKK